MKLGFAARVVGLWMCLLAATLGLGSAWAASPIPSPVAWLVQVQGKPSMGQYGQPKVPLRTPWAISPLYTGNELRLKAGDQVTIWIPYSRTKRVYTGPTKLRVMDKTVSVRIGEEPRVHALDQTHFDTLTAYLQHPYNPRAGLALAADGLQVLEPLHRSTVLTRQPVFRFAGVVPEDGQLILRGPDGKRVWVQQLDDELEVEFPPAADFQYGQKLTWEIRKKTGGRLIKGEFTIATESLAAYLLGEKPPFLARTPREDLITYGLKLEQSGAYLEAAEVWAYLGVSVDRSRWPYPPLPVAPPAGASPAP